MVYSNSIRRLLFISALLLSQLYVMGQTIRGIVLDYDTKEPLIGANLRWLQHPDLGTTTEVDGSFSLARPSKPDSLLVSYLGYQNWQGVLAKSDTSVTITLRTNYATIAPITVVAERRPARVFATEQLNRLDVYLNPAAKADVLLAINSLPAATNPDETANVSLRGSPFEATGIFLNNIPLYDAVRLDQPNGLGQFSIFNTSTVAGLDVHPSNPPLYLGQATAGAVSIRTSDQIQSSSRAINLHLAGGGIQWQQPLGEKSGLMSYINYGNHSFLKGGNPEALKDIDNFRSFDAAAYFTHAFSANTQLKIFQLWISERYGYQLTSGRFRGLFRQQKDRQLSIVNLSHQSRHWRFEWNQGFNWSEAQYEFGNIQTDLRQTDYHGNLLAHWQQQEWNGTLAIHYTLRQQQSEGTYPLYAEAWEVDSPSAQYQQFSRIRTPELAAFAKRPLGKQLVLGGGVRLGYEPARGEPLWAAQLLGNYKIDDQHQLTLASGRYYQLDWPRGEALLLHINQAYQLALDWRYQQGSWRSQLAVYRHWQQWRGQSNPIYGTEALVRYLAYPLQAWFSVSHVSSQIETDNYNYPSAFDFAFLVRAGLRWELPAQFTLTGNMLFRQGQYYLPLMDRSWEPAIQAFSPVYAPLDEGERLPNYQRLDLGLSKNIIFENSFLILYFNMNNALNHTNQRGFAFNDDYSQSFTTLYSQRTWFCGLVYQWE